jgi:hypothetical protein
MLQRHLCPDGIMMCMVLDLVADELDRLHDRIAGRFARAEPRAGSAGTCPGWSRPWAQERVDAGGAGG